MTSTFAVAVALAVALVALVAAATASVGGGRWRVRRRLRRVGGPALPPTAALRRRWAAAVRRYDTLWAGLVERTGPSVPARARRLVGAPVVGRSVLVTLVVVPFGAVPSFVAAAAVIGWPLRARRRQDRREAAEAVRALPDVIELLRLGVSAGLSVRQCVVVLARRLPPPAGPVLVELERRLELGERLVDTLPLLVDGLGPGAQPLVRAVADTERYGLPLEPVLAQLAADARATRRRRAEVAARRLPVLLLFPLVMCVLPAFGLLTVVPVLVSSLRSLGG